MFKNRDIVCSVEIGTSKICVLVGEISADENVICTRSLCGFFDQRKTVLLESGVIIGIHVVEAYDMDGRALEAFF